jgi:hypothetical protein
VAVSVDGSGCVMAAVVAVGVVEKGQLNKWYVIMVGG